MSVGTGRQNIWIVFWNIFIYGKTWMGTRHLYWILTGPSFAVRAFFFWEKTLLLLRLAQPLSSRHSLTTPIPLSESLFVRHVEESS